MEDRTQSRKWLLTVNNPDKYGMEHDAIKAILGNWKTIKYWCMCDEVGKEGTYHTHLFIYSSGGILFSTVKKKFPCAHIDFVRGTAQENRDYVRKEGKHKGTDKEDTNLANTFEEFGEVPVERQGQRNDLVELYDMVKSGASDYEILEANPEHILNMDKVERARQIVREEEFKNKFRELNVEYWFGDTGEGKTRTVMERYGYGNVYRVTNYKYPFDGYRGQDVVVFEEFYDSIRIQEMLTYLDGYPLELPCRYNNKIACYTNVYILSNVPFYEQYRDVARDHPKTFEAFRRRIHCIKEFSDKGIVDYQDMGSYDKDRFVTADDYKQVKIPFD